MLPPRMNEAWELYAGDPDQLTIEVAADGAPENLSDRTWTCHWRQSPSAATAVALSVDTTGASTGTLVVSVTGAQTAAMRSAGVFDVQGSDGITLLVGATSITRDVTR